MAKVFKLRIVKGKFTPEQFDALIDIVNTIKSMIGDSLTLVTLAKHPNRVIYILRFYVSDDFPDEKASEILKEVDLKIVDIVHSHFEGKRNVIALSFAEEDQKRGSDGQDEERRAEETQEQLVSN